MISINDTSLPTPASLSVHVTMQTGSVHYNALGQMLLDGRKEKRKVEIGWARLGSQELTALSSLLTGGFITLSYPDPLAGQREMEGLVTEKDARVWRFENNQAAWADVKLTVEER